MKLNFNIQLCGIDGIVALGEQHNLSKIMANLLGTSRSEEPIKVMDWALKLFNLQELDLDESDFLKLKNIIIADKTLFNIAKAPILKIMAEFKK